MSVTPLMWKSLHYLNKVFPYMWPCPLEWNISSRKLTVQTSYRKLIPWALNIFGFTAITEVVCWIIILSQILGKIQLDFLEIVITLQFLFLCMIGLITELILKFGANNLANTFNSLTLMPQLCGNSNV